eukprot:jgi/Tetstr1/446693/TSEL_003632.t1
MDRCRQIGIEESEDGLSAVVTDIESALRRRLEQIPLAELPDDFVIMLQVLADATRIYKKGEVKITVIVIKAIIERKNAHGKVMDGWSINSPDNCIKVCLYEGGDSYMDFIAKEGGVIQKVCMLQRNGIQLHGKQFSVLLRLGGDGAFLAALLGHAGINILPLCFFTSINMWCVTDRQVEAVNKPLEKQNLTYRVKKVSRTSQLKKEVAPKFFGPEMGAVLDRIDEYIDAVHQDYTAKHQQSMELWDDYAAMAVAWSAKVGNDLQQREEAAVKMRDAAEKVALNLRLMDCNAIINQTMHTVMFHFPMWIREHGCINDYSCQGVEHSHIAVKNAARRRCSKHKKDDRAGGKCFHLESSAKVSWKEKSMGTVQRVTPIALGAFNFR